MKNKLLFVFFAITLMAAAGVVVYAKFARQPLPGADAKKLETENLANVKNEEPPAVPAKEEAAPEIPVTGEAAPETPAAGETAPETSATGKAAPETPAAEEVPAEALTREQEKDMRVEQILGTLTLEKKVAQMFFITPELITGVDTVTVTGEKMKNALDKYPVGGIIYLGKNLRTPEQTKKMLGGAQDYMIETTGLPIFLGLDEEGGRVLRIGSNSAFGVERIKAMGILAKENDVGVIKDAGGTIGAYLKELGFNVDFAPDADVLTNSSNKVIGDRSFGSDPEIVAKMAWAYSEGLHEQGILACYKHFPGHGGTVEDSHKGNAYSYKTLDELRADELVPFKDGSEKGIDFIMVSHISAPNITGSDIPASLSKMLVTDVLRGELGYKGIVITDAMNMGAIIDNYNHADAAVMAVEAGCDMLLVADGFETAYNAVLGAVSDKKISEDMINASVSRIIRAKLDLMDNWWED